MGHGPRLPPEEAIQRIKAGMLYNAKKSLRMKLQVPPMPASQARAVIEEELGGLPLEEVFEWIDLDEPLGSASIAQVRFCCCISVVTYTLSRVDLLGHPSLRGSVWNREALQNKHRSIQCDKRLPWAANAVAKCPISV